MSIEVRLIKLIKMIKMIKIAKLKKPRKTRLNRIYKKKIFVSSYLIETKNLIF